MLLAIVVIFLTVVIVAIGSAARSRFRQRDIHSDSPPSSMRILAPAPVMSTLQRACFDCHSNETRWPWYSALPIASWLVEGDVKEGRGQINFSRWAQYDPFDRADMLDEICNLAASRAMPPWPYRMSHAEARLSEADVSELCAWSRLEATRLVEEGS
jgi:hypothetical protein